VPPLFAAICCDRDRYVCTARRNVAKGTHVTTSGTNVPVPIATPAHSASGALLLRKGLQLLLICAGTLAGGLLEGPKEAGVVVEAALVGDFGEGLVSA